MLILRCLPPFVPRRCVRIGEKGPLGGLRIVRVDIATPRESVAMNARIVGIVQGPRCVLGHLVVVVCFHQAIKNLSPTWGSEVRVRCIDHDG